MFTSWKLWAAGAAALVALSIIGGLIWKYNDLEQAAAKAEAARVHTQAELDTLKGVDAANVATIVKMQAQKATDDALIDALDAANKQIAAAAAKVKATVKEVYIHDQVSRDWAAVAVPDGVRDALNAPR